MDVCGNFDDKQFQHLISIFQYKYSIAIVLQHLESGSKFCQNKDD